MTLIFNQDLYIFATATAIFPCLVLFKVYSKTKILDFLIFSLFWGLGLFVGTTNILVTLTNKLIYYQLFEIFFDFWFILLLLHALRLNREHISLKILILALIYWLFLFILVINWKIFSQPHDATVIFIKLPHNYSSFFPSGAGFQINGIIVYSSGFRMLGDYFRIAIIIYLLISYYKLNPALNIKSTLKVKKLWIFTWLLFLVWNAINLLPIPSSYPTGLFLFVIGILIMYLSLKYPESMVLSQAQSLRVLKLYDLVNTDKIISNIEKDGYEPFLNYIKSIYQQLTPEEQLELSKTSKK